MKSAMCSFLAREALCSHLVSTKDTLIFQEVLKAQTTLLDGILNRIRTLAHAVFHIESVSDTVFCRKDVIGRTCHECSGFTFLVSIYDRSALCSEASVAADKTPATSQFRVLCLDCAVKRKPPLAGYNVAMPTWLSVSISRDVQPNAVITKIPNGVRSALPRLHGLRSDECVDLRWRFRHRLASVSLSDALTSIPRSTPAAAAPTEMNAGPSSAEETPERGLEFGEEERRLCGKVMLLKDLLAIDVPAIAPTERSFRLKLKQRQMREALKECLGGGKSSKKQRRCLEVMPGEVAAVKAELRRTAVKSEGLAVKDVTAGALQGASADVPYLRGRTCLQMIHEMESKPAIVPVRYISVPTSGTKLRSDSVPVVVTPSFGMQIHPPTEFPHPPSTQCAIIQSLIAPLTSSILRY